MQPWFVVAIESNNPNLRAKDPQKLGIQLQTIHVWGGDTGDTPTACPFG